MTRRRRLVALVLLAIALAPVASVLASLARTELLRASFQRQALIEARYPNAELLGVRVESGRLVQSGRPTATAPGAQGAQGAHCDFSAQVIYGTDDDFERVEAHYTGRSVSLGGGTPAALELEPISDRALSAAPLRSSDPDVANRELLIALGVDLARAQGFRTLFAVQALSWGNAAWPDWRCF